MSTGFYASPWRGSSMARAACVFALVLLLHLWALYVFSRGLSALPLDDVTQTTLSVSLLAPPPAPAVATQPQSPTRPRARNAPTITPAEPAAAPAPAPPEPAPPDAPPTPPKVADAPPLPAQASGLALGAQTLPTKGRIVYRTSYTRLLGITATTYVDWSIDPDKGTYELWLRTVDPAGLLDLRSTGTLRHSASHRTIRLEKSRVANRECARTSTGRSAVSFIGVGQASRNVWEGTQDPLSCNFTCRC